MNIISCNSCGVVLDKDKLNFPSQEDIYDEESGAINEALASYSQILKEFVPIVHCPVCEEEILDEGIF
jgi:hypothetical protein